MRIWILQRSEATPLDNNGEQRLMRVGIISKILVDKGHEVVWWTSTFDHYNRCHRFTKNTIINIKKNYSIYFLKGCGYTRNISLMRILENNLIAKQFSLASNKLDKSPDLILASYPTSELALEGAKYARNNNIPFLLDIRDLWPDIFEELLPSQLRFIINPFKFFLKWKLRKTAKLTTAFTAITDEFLDWGLSHSVREKTIHDRAFKLGYFPLKIKNAEKDECIKYWEGFGVSKKDFNVIYFGALGNVYNFNPIIEAAKILEKIDLSIKFVICGNGSQLLNLKAAGEKSNNLIVPGWIYRNKILSLMTLSNLGLAPYIPINSYLNTISNKIAEYSFGKLPIALSLREGLLYKKLQEYNAGIFYDSDPKILAKKILSLKSNNNRYEQLRNNSYQFFTKELDGARIYSQFADYIVNLAKEKT
tara:strand:- start:2502 stop:3761 length:1260 start_codon:yes stop_codon:yes gene_type:complete